MKSRKRRSIYTLSASLCLALLSGLLIAAVVGAQNAARQDVVKDGAAGAARADFAELERVALAEMQATGTPGAAIGIVSGDRLIYARGLGVADVETGAPVTSRHLFRLGSTTKMFTAAALVKLAEAGKLSLDEPIGKYARGLDPAIAAITSAQLLSHTGGLADNAVMFGKHDDEELGETVRALKRDALFTVPGRIYSYSNPGYWIAGYVIEALSRESYADHLEAALFRPLGMRQTTLRPTMAMTWPLAQGHEPSGGADGAAKARIIRPQADNAGNWPAGSIFSCVDDLSRFVIAMLNDGKLDGRQVLSPSLIAALGKPRVAIPGTENRYGLGLMSVRERGVERLQHGGSRSGYGSLISLVPAHRFGLIILVNRSGGSLPKTAEKAMEMMLPLEPKAERKAQPMTMTADEMKKYVGAYRQGTTRVDISIENGQLVLHLTLPNNRQQGIITKRGAGRFTVKFTNGSEAEFALVEGADGKAEYFHRGGRTLARE